MKLDKRIKYIVKEENRMVIAVIDNCRDDAINAFKKRTKTVMTVKPEAVIHNPRFAMQDCYQGFAYCHPLDVFDAEKGKQVARRRLLRKYKSSLRSHIIQMFKYYESWFWNMTVITTYLDDSFGVKDA